MGMDKTQTVIINPITTGRTNGLYLFESRIPENGVTTLIMLIVITPIAGSKAANNPYLNTLSLLVAGFLETNFGLTFLFCK